MKKKKTVPGRIARSRPGRAGRPAGASGRSLRNRPEDLRRERLAALLLREIDRIVFDLGFRKDMLFRLWSKHRTRQPLLQTLRSKYFDLSAGDLLCFPTEVIRMLDGFYRLLDSFIFYVSYTEDMPQALSGKFDSFLEELRGLSGPLIEDLAEFCPADELGRPASFSLAD